LIWVAHAENALSALDPATLKVKATVKLPGSPEAFQFDPSRPRLYVNIPEPPQAAVVDTDKNEVVARFPLKLAGANLPLVVHCPRFVAEVARLPHWRRRRKSGDFRYR